MFTGLIQTLGQVVERTDDGQGGQRLCIREPQLAPQLMIGESVAVNGVCLTVVSSQDGQFDFQVGPETLLRTNLGQLKLGDVVNLEQALRVGDRIGGHFVSGHVDAQGTIASRERSGEWEIVTFACPADMDRLMVDKGSIAVDGVSLTVVDVVPGQFRVMLIPHTLDQTTLGRKQVGDTVNLECDLLAKHVQKLIQPTVVAASRTLLESK